MPKITVKYDLPDEQYEYECAANGAKYRCVLDEMSNYFRKKFKYEELDDATSKALEECQAHFFECINTNGIEL